MGKVVRRGAEARQLVVEILKSGGNLEDAVAKTGFGRNYCRQLGVKAGFHYWGDEIRPDDWRKKRDTEILKLYRRGHSRKEMAEIMRLSKTTIGSVLRRNGITGSIKEVKTSTYEFRICPQCNTVFYCHENHNQRFCSKKCERQSSWKKCDPARRARKNNAVVDKDITLKLVADRDNNICYLCGGIVDWNNYTFTNGHKSALGQYPSIDHIVPLSKGGKHSWENVRLAHMRCNASKGVKLVG